MDGVSMAKDAPSTDAKLEDAKEAFRLCVDHEAQERKEMLDDIKFARLAEQWPEVVRRGRERDGRPCLTINRMPSFIRQVVNDARQNKPSIKVRPVDDTADPDTAEVISGLIRNIEYSSNADVAYDTADTSASTLSTQATIRSIRTSSSSASPIRSRSGAIPSRRPPIPRIGTWPSSPR